VDFERRQFFVRHVELYLEHRGPGGTVIRINRLVREPHAHGREGPAGVLIVAETPLLVAESLFQDRPGEGHECAMKQECHASTIDAGDPGGASGGVP